jgi:hypothetical protein
MIPADMAERVFSAGRTATSSSVFHSSHSGHLPSHFIWTLPHAEQTYCTLVLVAVFANLNLLADPEHLCVSILPFLWTQVNSQAAFTPGPTHTKRPRRWQVPAWDAKSLS